MTRKESNLLLEQAANLILQVEQGLSKDDQDNLRRAGYRIRISIGQLMDDIKSHREESYIGFAKHPLAIPDGASAVGLLPN